MCAVGDGDGSDSEKRMEALMPVSNQAGADAPKSYKEIALADFGFEIVVLAIFEDVIERHEAKANLGIAFPAPVLRFRISNQPVDRLRKQVVDEPSLTVVNNLNVAVHAGFFDEVLGQVTFLALDKIVELAAEEIAGVDRGQIEERGFAFRVAEGFQSKNWINRHDL
jgi:hypothetical protein